MKKAFLLLIITVLLFAFVACDGNPSVNEPSGSGSVENGAFSIGSEKFKTLQDAVDSLATKSASKDFSVEYTIKLNADVVDEGAVIPDISGHLVLDFGNYTYTLSDGSKGIVINNPDGTTIQNGSITLAPGASLSDGTKAVITTQTALSVSDIKLVLEETSENGIEASSAKVDLSGAVEITTKGDKKTIVATENAHISVAEQSSVVLTGSLKMQDNAVVNLGSATVNLTSAIEKGEDVSFYIDNSDNIKPDSSLDVDAIQSLNESIGEALHNHEWVTDTNQSQEPSCTAEGLLLLVCSTNSDHKKETILPATGHSFSEEWTVDENYHWHAAICEHVDETEGKKEHTWTLSEVVVESTEYSEGSGRFVCECGQETIQALPIIEWDNSQTYLFDKGGGGFSDYDVVCIASSSFDTIIVPNIFEDEPVQSVYIDVWSAGNIRLPYGIKRITIGEVVVDNISIPETVNSIQINKKVRNVQLEGESNFVLLDGCLYDKNKTTLIKVLANNEETIPIVSSVVSIGPWAFSWCNSLEYLCIPSTVTNIGSGAFYLCNNLEKVYIDNLSAWCGIDFNNSNPFPLDYSLYLNDGLVTSVTIPDSVTAINDYAFCGCSSITNVIIPESVTKIGICSFGYCSNLESISIPETLTSIGTHAFKTCNEIKEIIIPHSITYLGNSILEGVTTDMRVVYCGTPDELDEIISESNMTSGSNAKLFYMSEDLFEIDNEGAIRLDWDPGFENEEWDNLRYNFIIPRVVNNVEVKSIGEFAICLPLVRNVIIPDSVTKISDNAFINCVNLATIVIPDSVTVVGEMAFAGCSGLDCIIIPDSVTTIGAGAFAGCSNLLSVIVPDSVHYTGSGVFCGCSSLQSVPEAYVSSLTGDIGFFFTPEAFGLLDGITIYTGSDGSSFYGEFANCSSLNMEIVLPEGVTSAIGAFDKCEKVKKISFPHSMVGYDNSDLLQYYFEDRWSWRNNLMWLWDYCYIQYNCPKLEEVSFTGNIYEWRGCIPVSNPADEMDSAGITYLYTEEVPDEILFRIEEFRWPPVEEGWEIELNTLVLNIWPNDYNENEDQYDYNFIDMYLRHGVSGHKDLPSTLDGKPVEAIWFSSRPSYDSISIPDSVTHIISLGDSEFGKKYALYIGEGVEYIWSPLEGVEIIHVTSLDNLLRFVSNSNELGPGWIWPSLEGWRLYIGEKELTSIRLGEDKLPRFAFAHCDSIEEIYIKSQESIPTYDSCGYRIYDVFITNSIKRVYLEYDGSFDYIWYGSSTYEIDVYVFRQGSYVLLD